MYNKYFYIKNKNNIFINFNIQNIDNSKEKKISKEKK